MKDDQPMPMEGLMVAKTRNQPLLNVLCNLWQGPDHKRRLSEKDVNDWGL
jgi:hypothetical protein